MSTTGRPGTPGQSVPKSGQPKRPTIHLLPTPARQAETAAAAHYEAEAAGMARYLPLSRDEVVVIAHMRGHAHFGPLCRMCRAETRL